MRAFIIALTVAGLPATLAAQATDSAREAEVRGVVEGFHSAIEAGDSTAALAFLHPDAVIFESGHAETVAQYRSGHVRGDIAFAGATDRQVTREQIHIRGDEALYTSVSRTTGQYRSREIDSQGAETMVLVRTADGWRILHIHWSSAS